MQIMAQLMNSTVEQKFQGVNHCDVHPKNVMITMRNLGPSGSQQMPVAAAAPEPSPSQGDDHSRARGRRQPCLQPHGPRCSLYLGRQRGAWILTGWKLLMTSLHIVWENNSPCDDDLLEEESDVVSHPSLESGSSTTGFSPAADRSACWGSTFARSFWAAVNHI
ncbi:hypothetical protein LX32DRAFT_229276 [Colletotrichum zoysiae]|uniref:Protein kinase domain-containing protein n=1 Tax=Colletotrichum zoysiae TaxID=1216348 RepID=A0AAD9LUR3_9PEZI|nr:hypothetical protein LX32DRAFT_229276 [Colletotrichum zoysiae]